MKKLIASRNKIKNRFISRSARGFALLLIGLLFVGTEGVLAQRVLFDNNNHIPQRVRSQVAQWDRTGDGSCNGNHHAQHVWLSPPNNPTAAGVIDVQRGTSSIPIWFNASASNCLVNVRNDGTGRIITTDLKHTRYNLHDASAVVSGSGSGTLSVALPGTPGGDARNPLLSYQESYDVAPPHLRYIKNWGNRHSEAHNVTMTLSGTRLSNLPVGDYTVTVTARAKLVNHFDLSGGPRYQCVFNSPTTTNNTRDGLNRCRLGNVAASFTLRVREQVAGVCSVYTRPGTSSPLAPGQPFGLRFSVRNTGLQALLETEVAMQRQGTTAPRWPLDDNHAGEMGTYGSVRFIASDTYASWNTSSSTFTAPTTPGRYTWTFELIKHSGSPGGVLNRCSIDLTVGTPTGPINRPYLHVRGGDVYSGASFANAACTPTSAAQVADISTNGYSSEGDPGSATWESGSSQSQYAVLASGQIGDGSSPSTDTFLGNYGYLARPRNSLTPMNPLRDALFANQQDRRGSYYEGSPEGMPCVGDIGDIEALIAAGGPEIYTGGSWGELVDFIGDDRNGIMVVDEADVEAYFGSPGGPSPSVDILPGVRKIIIVDGNLHIQGNIEYPGTYNNLADIPYVQFIARGGNIYLDQHVTRHIDAHLMALPRIAPDGTQTRGIIDTCATHINRGQWVTPLVAGSCYKQPTPGVIINGSVIARRVLWKHTSGTLGQDGEYIPSIPGLVPSVCSAGVSGEGGSALSPGRYRQCAAELINFSPEAHLRRFGGDVSNSYSNTPAMSQELPPIY